MGCMGVASLSRTFWTQLGVWCRGPSMAGSPVAGLGVVTPVDADLQLSTRAPVCGSRIASAVPRGPQNKGFLLFMTLLRGTWPRFAALCGWRWLWWKGPS